MAVALAAAEAVAALPGGGAMAGIAAQVNGDSAALSGIADNWGQAQEAGAQHTTSVTSAVNQVAADWKGTAQESFTSLMQRFAQASQKVQEQQLVGKAALTAASQTIQQVQGNIEKICENALSQVNEIHEVASGEQGVTQSQITAAITKVTSKAVSEAQAQVKAANTALEQVSSKLASALQAMGEGTFSSLPTPSANGTTPQSNSGTNLAGAGGGSGGGDGGGSSGGGDSGGGGGGASGEAGGGSPAAPAQVNDWIEEAIKVLEAHGVPASELNANDISIIIMHESSGNPDAINLTDSNAAAGDPSQGLMQTIPSTFQTYALPGYNSSITNPVDNIIAGVRYAISRYGSLSNVPGVVAVNNGQPYVGY
jgi:SLT domain-containing protein